jgi:hypothetical protein
MFSPDELINEALSLPVEERTRVADYLLRSLNTPRHDIDRQWLDVTQERLRERHSGTLDAVSGDDVMARMRARFTK